MNRKRRFLIIFISVFLICLFGYNKIFAAGTPKINASRIRLLSGNSYRLKVTGTTKKVTWSSKNTSVAYVRSNGKVIARKAGVTTVLATVGKKQYTCKVIVNDTVDVIVFAGQSNMTGVGNRSSAPSLISGAGYAFNYVTSRTKLSTLKEPFGYGQDDSYFYNGPFAKGSMVTSFVNAYYRQTRTPVVAVPAAAVGTGSVSWRKNRYKGVIKRVNSAVSLVKKKGLKVGHVYMVWMQGENDAFAGMSAVDHTSNLKKIVKNIMAKTKVEKCMVIGLPTYYNDPLIHANYNIIRSAQTKLCRENSNFILISKKASSLSTDYLQSDGVHLTQSALNLIGTDAGNRAGIYAKKH